MNNMSTLINDIKYAFRQLRKSPGFTTIAVLSLSLGIGANTAIFSLLNAVMLRSLPVRNPHQLRVITWQGNINPPINWTMLRTVFSYQTYQEFRDHGVGLSEVFAFSDISGMWNLTVFANGRADAANGMMVSGNFFRGLELDPLMGRMFTSDHDKPGAEPVTVISYAAWQRYFAGEPKVVGETVMLNRHSFTIIGVLPKGFHGLVPGERRDFYIPMSAHPLMRNGSAEETTYWWLQVMARLAPDAEESQVRTSLETLFAQTTRDVPSREPRKYLRIVLKDGHSGLLASQRDLIKSLYMLLGLVGIVLLIACVNLAGLMLARCTKRQHELSVRAALGAGRLLLIRQLLVESFLIALAGAGLGLVLAYLGKTVLFHLLLPSGAVLDLRSDSRVLVFTLVVSLVTALSAGLLPAFRSTSAGSVAVLKDRSSLVSPRLRLGRTLVSLQIGLSLLLLMGAGLFARTLVNLYRVDTGFNTENLLVFQVKTLQAGLREQQSKDFHERFYTSLCSLPGVQSVSCSNLPLLAGVSNNTTIRLPNRSKSFQSKEMRVNQSFLRTMGIPLLMGRDFNVRDFETSQKVIIVNQAFTKSACPNENPIDKIISSGFGKLVEFVEYRIVGVCGDINYDDIRGQPEPMVLIPDSQYCQFYKVRTAVNPQSLIPIIRKTLAAVNPTIPLTDVKTQAIQLDESIARERCFASLAFALALLAVLLACIGLYGVMAYNVACRTGEIGIRMALGAGPKDVAWSVLRSALLIVTAGIAMGVPAVFALVKIVRNYLFGIEPYDPVTIAGTVILLVIFALAAAWVPTRRAAKVDPMEALRYE
jgi:predicted permease